MKLYWKVHIKNFDIFVGYIMKEYKYFTNELYHFKKYYAHKYEYLYFFVSVYNDPITNAFSTKRYQLKFIPIDEFSTDVKNKYENYRYMGEFNPRKEKLKFLNNKYEL